ncbi:hypothetical protein XENOCAPTIV_026501 [Xenoophorus captivus]|uniref:TRPM-like domain-containing protein n=1 Tax=Xenoophorus captivus TaxID=1517983 RepID=A0ABV0RSS0_9TELE
MTSALVGNNPQFVSLLLENGVCLRDFLQDDDTLCELYRQLPNCFFLYKLAQRVKRVSGSSRSKVLGRKVGEKISLTHVSDEVRHLLGNFTKPIYPPSTMTYHLSMDTSVSVSMLTQLACLGPSICTTFCIFHNFHNGYHDNWWVSQTSLKKIIKVFQ